MRRDLAVVFLVVLPWLAGCSQEVAGPPEAPDRLSVFASITPQAYFVERVGGQRVDVGVLVQPGQSPATYEPTPKQLVALGKSDVYFRTGVPFEVALMKKIEGAFKNLNIVDCRKGIELRRMKSAHHHDGKAHHEGETDAGHEEHAEGMDPHVWLDPMLVKIQAKTICDELCRLDPDRVTEYRANLAAFYRDLDAVHARIAETLAPLEGRKFYVYHPAFGYFGDRYGLVQEPVEIEGKDPSAKQLSQLIKDAKSDKVKVIFVQAQFPARSAEAVAQAMGGAVVSIDPLARDYLKNLERMASEIGKALGLDSSGPIGKGAGS